MQSLKARKIRAGPLRLEKLQDRHQDNPREEGGGEIKAEQAEPFQKLSEELTSAWKDPYYEDSCSSGDSESVLSIDVDMPLSIRLPKVRRKESKRHSSAAASAGSGARGGGDGDAASLASAMSASTNSVKSLGLALDEGGYSVPKVKDLPRLHRAVWKCDMNKVKTATKGIKANELNSFDKGRRTALHLACSKAHKEIIIHLCSLHANVNLQDGDGATPMHKLVETKNTECLSTLIACGGNPNLTDKNGQSPLHLVAKTGDVEASIILLEGDATVDAMDKNGMSALHIAVLNGHRKLAASLIADGFFVDAQDGQGRTPLMIAAAEGRIGLIKLLSENKADPDINDSNMFKAIDYAVTRNHPECARLIEEHEREMERERQLEAEKPPRRGSLVDHTLIEEYYGPPSLKRKGSLSSRSNSTTPTKTTPTKAAEDTPIKDAEVDLRKATPTSEPWADSESEEEEMEHTSSKVNLRAALEKRASLKSVEGTPTGSAQHYKLPTKGIAVDKAERSDDHSAGSESDGESVDQTQPQDSTKTTAQKKLEATLLASRQEVGGVSPVHSSPVDADVSAAPQPMEKIGGNLPHIPGGGKAKSALSLSPKKREGSELKKATPTRGRVNDYDNDFDSGDSDVDAVPEELSEGEGEGEESEEEDEPAGYNPWMSFGTASSTPGSRRVSPRTSPLTSPTHVGGGFHDNSYQTPTKMAISPLTKSIRSNNSMTPPPSAVTPPTSGMDLGATKTPSTSVDIGGREQLLVNEQEREGVKDLPEVLSSTTDQVAEDEGENLTGEKEKEGERGASLNVCLSSATDQPRFSSQQTKKSEKESALPGFLSSSTDQEKGGVAVDGGLADEEEKGATLAASPSSGADQPLKKASDLPKSFSSATDQPLRKGTSLDSYAMDLQPFKKEAGLPSSLSSSTDQPLKRGASFDVDQPLKKGVSLDQFLSSSTGMKKGEKVPHGASLTSFPSSATDPSPPSPVHKAAAVSPPTKPQVRSGAAIHRDDSMEGLLTVDEELTDSDDNDDSYDYVEEVVSSLAYVPSDPTVTSKRRGETLSFVDSPENKGEKERIVSSKSKKVSPVDGHLSTGTEPQKLSTASLTPAQQTTPTKAKSPTPSQQVATPISDSSLVPVSPLSAGVAISEFTEVRNASATEATVRDEVDNFSDILKSDDDDDDDDDEIEKLLGEAEQLNVSQKKMSAADKRDASELFASVIKAAEERETAEKKTVDDAAVGGSKQVRGEPTSQKKKEDVILDIEAQYEDSEWDSEDEESDGESDNEEEGGGAGTALTWLSNTGLADPFLSPLTSPTHSAPTTPRREIKPRSQQEETAAILTTNVDAAVTSSADADTGRESKKKEEGEEEKRERKVDEPGREEIVSAEPGGHPLERKETLTHLPENEEEEKKGERHTREEIESIEDDNEQGQSLVRKETVTHLTTGNGVERGKEVPATVAAVAEPGHPLIRKETLTHLTEDKGGVDDSIQATTAAVGGHNEQGHPLERKDTLTHLPNKKGEKDRKKDGADSVPLKAADNEPGRPLERKVTASHLPAEIGKKEGLHSAVQQHPRSLGLAVSPGRHVKPMGVVTGRGLVSRLTDGDDTEEDVTAFTNTESEGSPLHSPGITRLTLIGHTPPLPPPTTSTALTRSQPPLHSSPLQLHQLTLSPIINNTHGLDAAIGGGLMGGAAPEVGGVNLFGRQSSLSEPTSPVETQASQDPLSEISKMSDDLPLGPLMRLNQSLTMGGALLLNSTHTTQLQESLHETRRSLERSHHAHEVAERSRRQLEAKLDDFQRRYDEMVGVKHTLESQQLGLEHEVRELKYQLEQAKQELKSREEVSHKLQEQLTKMESRLNRETEGRENAELRRRELEIAHTGLTVSYQHLEEMLSELRSQLQVEKEAKQLQDTLSKEQLVQFQLLQSDSRKVEDQRAQFLTQLQAADSAKQTIEEKMAELKTLNTQLEAAKTSLERQAGEQQQELQCLRSEVEKTKAELIKTTGDLEKTVEERDRAKEELERSREEQRGMKEDLEKMRREVGELQVEVERRKGEQKMTKDEVNRTQRELDVAKRDLERTRLEEERSKRELEKTRREASQLQMELGVRKGEEEMRKRELEMAKGEGETAKSELESTRRALSQAQVDLEVRKGELERASQELSHVQSELETRRGEEERAKAALESARGEMENTRRELQQYQMKLERSEEDLVRTSGELERVREEAAETRQLFEGEVRSKSKLIADLEKSQAGISQAVEKEKRRTRKALDLKKSSDMQCQHLQEQAAKLQSEVMSLRSQLKDATSHTHQLEMAEAQMREEFERERVELERGQGSSERESVGLRRLLESTQQQLKKEVELRHQVEHDTAKNKKDMEVLQKEAAVRQKELSKAEKLTKKLRDELQSLNAHVAANMVGKADFEAYKRAVNEKARQELCQKLEQVNTHLEQQSQAQEALDRIRSSTESEWKHKYEETSQEMRQQLGQARSDRESLLAVAARYKELYECEHRRAEKLNNRLQRAKEETIETETRLSRERLRTQQLLNMSQSGISSLSPPQARKVVFTTSTPANIHIGTPSPSASDELLSSVRAELDKSITRHLDMATVPTTTATRSTYSKKATSPELSSKYSHLESIKRNYRI